MKKKSLIIVALTLILTLAMGFVGCSGGGGSGELADVESIEIVEPSATLAPGDHIIKAKCLPANSKQGFTAKLSGQPAAVLLKQAENGDYILTVGASAMDGATVKITVTSTYNKRISSKKDFKLAIPEPTYTMIDSEAGLIDIANDMSGCYKLTQDIALTKDWVQLGDAEAETGAGQPNKPSINPFKGILDGNGYKITKIKMVDTNIKTGYNRGFFGRIEGGTVRNIGFEGNMNFAGWSGVIAAQNYGVISNVYTDVKLNVNGGCAGALVVTNGGFIENSYAIGSTVSGSENEDKAGLIGVAEGIIEGCYADREATGLSSFAGFRNTWDNAEWNTKYLQTLEIMQTKQTFIDAGWSETRWELVDGYYPKLKHIA